MNILFYSPFDQRARDNESLMIAFKNQGHRVMSLSQSSGAGIHDFLRPKGIEVYSHIVPTTPNVLYFLKHVWFLVSFCREKKVDIIYSHLEPANLVASIAQYCVGAKVFLVRHHVEEAAEFGFDKSFTYRLTYALAKKIITVSDRAKEYMIRHERIPAHKIIRINLAYDFDLYAAPDPVTVKKIMTDCNCKIILLSAGRMVRTKRLSLAIDTLSDLVKKGLDAKLILLGTGEMREDLESYVKAIGLETSVIFPGHVTNVTDYLRASDFLLHPSSAESSCVVAKEAAITGTPVIACKDVGDFDDYMITGVNGFLASRDNFVAVAAETILTIQPSQLKQITKNLNKKVRELFSLEHILSQYDKLNQP